MRIHYVGLASPVITAIEDKIKGETPEEIQRSLLNDISLFELELLLDWYEQLPQSPSAVEGVKCVSGSSA